MKHTSDDTLVSIITPVLNGANYIEKCIKSVSDQIEKVEHIIIDGGSKDNTIEILNGIPDIIWSTGSDVGMYDAINKGIKIANGDIITYLNADDRYYERTISKVIDAFRNMPEVDYVYGSCTYINSNEESLYTYKPLPYSNKLLRNMRRITWAQPSCFWRRSVHEKIGIFNSKLKYCGDYEFFTKLFLNDLRGYRINEPISYFMIHSNSLSVKSREEMAIEYKQVILKHDVKRNIILGIFGEALFKLINIKTYLKDI